MTGLPVYGSDSRRVSTEEFIAKPTNRHAALVRTAKHPLPAGKCVAISRARRGKPLDNEEKKRGLKPAAAIRRRQKCPLHLHARRPAPATEPVHSLADEAGIRHHHAGHVTRPLPHRRRVEIDGSVLPSPLDRIAAESRPSNRARKLPRETNRGDVSQAPCRKRSRREAALLRNERELHDTKCP